MNAITSALQVAGVKLPPLNKRVWLWLNDHPGKTSKEVATAIGATHASVSSTLGNMVKRGMCHEELRPYGHKHVLQYSTNIKTFELLPLRKKAKLATPGQHITYTTELVPKPTKTPLEAIPAPLLATLEQYTLKELRVIHAGLTRLFEYI